MNVHDRMVEDLRAKVKQLRNALQEVEFVTEPGMMSDPEDACDGICPWCGAVYGHELSCERQKALEDTKGV